MIFQDYQEHKHTDLTEKIINAAFEVHKAIGPGFDQEVYSKALKLALDARKLKYDDSKKVQMKFNKKLIGTFQPDLIVEGKVLLYTTHISGMIEDYLRSYVISYLKACEMEVGLLLNFGNDNLDIRRLSHYKDKEAEGQSESKPSFSRTVDSRPHRSR